MRCLDKFQRKCFAAHGRRRNGVLVGVLRRLHQPLTMEHLFIPSEMVNGHFPADPSSLYFLGLKLANDLAGFGQQFYINVQVSCIFIYCYCRLFL